jgi:Flp pilus assembly protein TadD
MRLRPGWPYYHNKLGLMLEAAGRTEEAGNEYREALRLKPDLEDARNNLRRLHKSRSRGKRSRR